MRLIDAEALCEKLRTSVNGSAIRLTFYSDVRDLLAKEPTVDPVKHGYWTVKEKTPTIYGCSVCGSYEFQSREYCPHCGAKMDADRPPKVKWRLRNGKWTCSECGNKLDFPLQICNVCASEMEIEL